MYNFNFKRKTKILSGCSVENFFSEILLLIFSLNLSFNHEPYISVFWISVSICTSNNSTFHITCED
jgi:hypothetical protein